MQNHEVLVTSIGGISVGSSIAKALCCSDKIKYIISATDMLPLSGGLFLSKKGYMVPSAKSDNYIEEIIRICKNNELEAVFPGHEAELKIISDNRKRFEEIGVIPMVNDYSLISSYHDKLRQASFLNSKGIKCPKTVALCDAEGLISELGFPVIMKSGSTLTGGGSRTVHIIKDKQDLDFYGRKLQKAGISPILQEYIGSISNEYTIGVLTSKAGKIIDSIALHRHLVGLSKRETYKKKETVYGTSMGLSQGIFEDNPAVQKAAEDIALKVGSRGPLNIQARWIDGELVVFELNPRFSATVSMRAAVGFNDPDTVFRNFVLSEEFGRLNYQKNVVAMQTFANVFIPLENYNHLVAEGSIENKGDTKWKFW